MQPFKVHILGCGSAKPTPRHLASSQVVEIRGKLFLVDCAEGTQTQLMRSRLGFAKINNIFISHLHGDHCFGLMGLINSFGLLDRTAPMHIFAPAMGENIFQQLMEMFCPHPGFNVTYHPVDTYQRQIIYEDRSLTVETIPLEHRVPCCGFLFREKPSLPHINREMIDFYHIPVSQINNIKVGMDWTTDEGETIPNQRLVFPADPPRAYAYCSDTKYLPQLAETVKKVDLLYHESTYGDDKTDNAEKYCHSTARQAAMVARDAKAKKLMLGHYSARYNDETVLLCQAQEIFPNTILSNEGLVVNV
ncbi:MAG: ribonuclease Z [Prevotella sp.]|nr:ribonuclease Z [Prevotella sp.]